MDNTYTEIITLESKDVNMYRHLRTSRLFEIIQEISIKHTEELGAGRKKTLDKGLLWVVTMYYVQIDRMPEFDETLTVESWPGETMHLIFPRFYRILDATGQEIVRASALWTLVDCETRKCIFPEKYGIEINGCKENAGIELPSLPTAMDTLQSFEFAVPFSYVDLNGHMNNTRYFDMVDDYILSGQSYEPRIICTEFTTEIKYGESVQIQWGNCDKCYFIQGKKGKTLFKMSMEMA